MCVIIVREPGADVPGAMLERACDVNKHGFGFSWLERGHIRTERSLAQPNSPTQVTKLLKQFPKHKVFLHLRHATVGPVSLQNNHPFYILEKRRDGVDLCMMHNGTMYTYDPKGFPESEKESSDTLIWAKYVVRPMALRCLALGGKEKSVLDDKFFLSVLKRDVYSSSKVVLFDNFGRVEYLNKDQGKDFDGFWASNDYSFDDNHARSSVRSTPSYGSYGTYGNHYGGYDDYRNGGDHWSGAAAAESRKRTSSSVATLAEKRRLASVKDKADHPILPWERVTDDLNDPLPLFNKTSVPTVPVKLILPHEIMVERALETDASALRSASVWLKSWIIRPLREDRVSNIPTQVLDKLRTDFVTKAGINALTDLGRLSRDQLEEFCSNFPAMAAEAMICLVAREEVSAAVAGANDDKA